MKAKERARAVGPLVGGARAGLREARSGSIGWRLGGGDPEGARFCGSHGGNRGCLPESERGCAGWAGWGRRARFLRLGDAHGPAGTLRPRLPA